MHTCVTSEVFLLAGTDTMKYIRHDKMGWDHRPYWRYLQDIRDSLPSSLYNFASNPENHDLNNPNSLHDAWLRYIKVTEARQVDEKHSVTDISLCFLGPMHDRYINLSYKGVIRYLLTGPNEHGFPSPAVAGHGDLLVHELTIHEHDVFCHELLFSSEASFSIYFREFLHSVEPL